MQFFLALTLIGGILAVPSPQRVGCENDPCDHQCIDTVSSYFCQCFENWELQPDQHTCLPKAQKDYDAAYMGCWLDKEERRDLQYLIWTRPEDCNVPQCLHDCRARGFAYAGLQNGNQCYCGNNYARAYNDTGLCNMPCPGSSSQMCGGDLANSVYKVTRDSRYVGCYHENEADPDLPAIMWGVNDGRSVDACNVECARNGYLYAGLFNGGQCACGSSYGKHLLAGEAYCMVRCRNGWGSQNCGGNSSNAIYRTEKGRDFTYMEDHFSKEGKMASLPVSEMYLYPHQLGLYGKRIVMYASDTVNNIKDDVSCTDGTCYNLCGEISVPPGFDRYREDVVIRKFYLKLSELPGLIQNPEVAQAIYVYVQTLYVDQSTTLPYAIYIRARQVIINYAADPSITFDHEARELKINITEAIYTAAPSDLTFQKQSLLCARMMISSANDEHNRIGWDIIDDLVRDRSYTPEQHHFLDSVRALRSEFTSIGRNDIYFAPYYTQEYYTKKLDLYYREITLYHDAFEDLLDDAIDCNNFKNNAGFLIDVWSSTVVANSLILVEMAEDNLAVSEAVYQRMYHEYNESRQEMEEAEEDFREGLEKWKRQQMAKMFFRFLIAIMKMAFGIFPCGAKDIRDDDVAAVIASLELLEVTMENLAYTMEQVEAFVNITDEIIETKDYERYMDNVESVAGLYALIPEWSNLAYQIHVIFAYDEFRNIEGAMAFSFAVFDLCNWGEALTRSMVEYATSIRQFMMFDALYQSKVEMRERYEAYFLEIGEECEQKDKMVIAFAEQQYDISIELNDQLISFCQAMYYERLEWCRNASRPNFAASVENLLSSISSAHTDALDYSRNSPGEITIQITDEDTAWDNCSDATQCPIKKFRESGILYYELPTNHSRFLGLNLFVVEEVRVYIPGAVSLNSSTDLRLLISASGPFINRIDEDESTFISRALPEMYFAYDIETCNIELFCKLYQPQGDMIKHMTPFTTWLIQRDPGWTFINFDDVTSVELTLMGHFRNSIKVQDQEGIKASYISDVLDDDKVCEPTKHIK